MLREKKREYISKNRNDASYVIAKSEKQSKLKKTRKYSGTLCGGHLR